MASRRRNNNAATPQRQPDPFSASNGMFFTGPAPPAHASRPSVSPLMSRDLKPPRQVLSPPGSCNQLFQDGGSVDADCSATEKLAFDELLRVQRGRAEDIGKMIASLGASLGNVPEGNQNERDKNRRATKYREEWRVAREDDVLARIRDGEARDRTLSAEERVNKAEALRSHVRRSIHCFLIVDRGGDALAATKAKLSNDLIYAQQMDRLLREMDQEDPFTVVRQAIVDARAKFQQLFLHCSQASEATRLGDKQRPESSSSEELPTAYTGQETTNLLDLYENVVGTRSVAQSISATVTGKGKNKTPRPVPPIEPSVTFLENLEKQREEAEMLTRETLAQSHWRTVCANRIRRTYIQYRKGQHRRRRMSALAAKTRQRAAIVLQTAFLRAVRAFRALTDAQMALKCRHQGRRIAAFCFWRWIYLCRCGFASFQFQRIVPTETIAAILCIQSHWRRRRAVQDVTFHRAFQAHRTRRHKQRQWNEWRKRAQALAPMNLQFAEWQCHVAIEKQRVAREQEREHQRFIYEWTRYEARLEKDVLKAKLASEWIPQLDPLSGETFYLNVQTTKTTNEHPNRILLRQLLKKQRQHAEKLYEEKQQRLQQYTERLDDEINAMMEKLNKAYSE